MELLVRHECTDCGATIEECDKHLREQGRPCCATCSLAGTHGLLPDASKDLGEQVGRVERQTEGHTKLLAQMVIFRSEAADAIRQLRAVEHRHQEEISQLRERVETLERLARQHFDATAQLVEQFEERLAHSDANQAATYYTALQERVEILELCIEGIEKKFNLKRRTAPPEETPPELAPPPPAAIAAVADEPRRKRLRRKRDADESDDEDTPPESTPPITAIEDEPRRRRRRRRKRDDDEYDDDDGYGGDYSYADGWD